MLTINAEWGLRYSILIDRYTNIIRGIFSGHTHEDDFQLIKSRIGNEISAVVHINPALTTYHDLNPSFRLYEMDAETFTLLDYVQYRLYIEEANRNRVPEWKKAYRFTELYQVPNLDYNNFQVIVDRINNDTSLYHTFLDMFLAEGPRGAELEADPGMLKYLTCRLTSSDVYDFNECTGGHYVKLEFMAGYGFLSKFLDAKWEYAYYQ